MKTSCYRFLEQKFQQWGVLGKDFCREMAKLAGNYDSATVDRNLRKLRSRGIIQPHEEEKSGYIKSYKFIKKKKKKEEVIQQGMF